MPEQWLKAELNQLEHYTQVAAVLHEHQTHKIHDYWHGRVEREMRFSEVAAQAVDTDIRKCSALIHHNDEIQSPNRNKTAPGHDRSQNKTGILIRR
ncbi:hypothetical protein D3C77_624530 [compost metagenome]